MPKFRDIAQPIANRRAHGGVQGVGHAVISGFSLAKRAIPFSPGFSIDRNGVVWTGEGHHRRVETTSMLSPKGVQVLAVILDADDSGGSLPVRKTFAVWKLLSQIWYENKIVLPRDGNAMSLISDNVILLGSVSDIAGGAIADMDEILLVWTTYSKGVGCWNLAEKTRLVRYSRDQFFGLIKDVLVAGIL